MLFVRLILLPVLCAALFGSDAPVQMDPFLVRPSDFNVDIEYDTDTQAIIQIRIGSVMPGSAAEKRGIRKGDRIVAIDGVPVVKLRRSEVIRDRRIAARDELIFEGSRGLFGKKWSLTVKLHPSSRNVPNKAPEPTSTSVTSPVTK